MTIFKEQRKTNFSSRYKQPDEAIKIPLKSICQGDYSDHESYEELIRAHYKKILRKDANLNKPILSDLDLDSGFQPEINCEFPNHGNTERIPRIVHHVWLTSPEDGLIPTQFLNNIKSYFKHNPDWTYFFWTNKTVRAMLADRHPSLLPVFDSFDKIVVKGDMIRYVILYEFGGLYADYDTECQRPMDIATKTFPCMLVTEPFEHAAIWYDVPYMLINAIMMCRPKHAFFKQLLEAIPSRQKAGSIVYKLGPGFLTEQYKKYINVSKTDLERVDINQDTTSPYFYKGTIPPTHNDGIYIPNTRFFMDSPSPALANYVNRMCKNKTITGLNDRVCHVVKNREYLRKPGKYSFLDHQWTHTWSNTKVNNTYEFVSIKKLTNNLKIYTKDLTS